MVVSAIIMDCVYIEGLEVRAHHGVSEKEREAGHRFRFDVRLYFDTRSAAESDDLSRTVDYGEVVRVIVEESTQKTVKLVEFLANRIVDTLFSIFPNVQRIYLKVSKLDPPVGAVAAAAGVEITRERQQAQVDHPRMDKDISPNTH